MNARDWHGHFEAIDDGGVHDLAQALRQVGKTTMGQAVAQSQVKLLVDHARRELSLQRSQRCIDLGCGNGLLTAMLADEVAEVLAFDFSQAMLKVARAHYGAANIRYECADLTALPQDIAQQHSFDRAFSCEVLQHLDASGVQSLLQWLARHLVPGGLVLLCGIPDRERLRAFYNTHERWAYYERRVAEGTEQIGTWWTRAELSFLASASGFRATFIDQPRELYTAHYRFDVRLELP